MAFEKGTDRREVPDARDRHWLDPRSGRAAHRAHQLPDRPLPGPQEGSSRSPWAPQDGRKASPSAQLPEAHGCRRLPQDHPGTGPPVLVHVMSTIARAQRLRPARFVFPACVHSLSRHKAMMQRIEKTFAGRKLVIETGRMAKQAAGSALVQFGDTMVLAAVTVSATKSAARLLPAHSSSTARRPTPPARSRRVHQARRTPDRRRDPRRRASSTAPSGRSSPRASRTRSRSSST